MWKGVKSSSYVVWVTVPLPIIFIVIMMMNGLTLDNSDAGLRMYLKGYDAEGNPPNLIEKLTNGKMWSQACGQIFFSLGVCMGTMCSYSSFNPIDKPIIGDAIKIALINSCLSFLCGFAVFSVVGYLIGIGSPVSSQTASIGLAFIAYPAAVETMPAPNFWAFILALTLFTLGIDCAFSMLEACATVMHDSPLFKKWPKKVTALFLCVLGSLGSILFCFNWGFTLFDVVDNYVNIYLTLNLGLLETMAAGWVYEAEQIFKKGNNYKVSLIVLASCYWAGVFIFPVVSIFSVTDYAWIGMPAFWVYMLFVWGLSWYISGL